MVRQRLDYVTIFRFISAFYVFVFHSFIRIEVHAAEWLKAIMYNGAIGMSFFFVLSGFILTYNYDTKVGKDYFKKRVLRIYPAYILCGILTLPFLIEATTFNYEGIVKFVSILFLFLTSTQGWIYSSFSSWQFGGTWSISVEMFFYAVFPLLLVIANSDKFKVMAFVSLIAACIIMPIALVFDPAVKHIVFYAGPMYRLPEFAMGIVAAKLMQRGVKINIAVLAIALAALLYVMMLPDYGWMQHGCVVTPATCVILIFLAQLKMSDFSSKLMKPLVYLGEISYSFYLMQLVVFMYLDKYHPAFIYDNGYLGWLVVFLITIPLSHISYHLFEQRKIFRLFKRS